MSKKFSYFVVVVIVALAIVVGVFSSADPASAHSSQTNQTSIHVATSIWASQPGYAVFQALNRHRAAAGLRALQWSNALTYGAHKHNLAMASANTLAHLLPGEPGLATRVKRDCINCRWAGENIGVIADRSLGGALSLDRIMINERAPGETGHRQNILSPYADAVGVDVLVTNGKLWLTEDFARI